MDTDITAPFFPPLLNFFICLTPPFLIHALCSHASDKQRPPLDCLVLFEMKKGAGSVFLRNHQFGAVIFV